MQEESTCMVKKKLLTLAGVVGILACGACFLPPLPQHKPAPPPIPNRLFGVQTIRVEVTNASLSHHLDPDILALKVAESINAQSWKMKVNAQAGKEARGEDALLVITVLSETLEAEPAMTVNRTFLITDTATLTRTDGALAWQEVDAGSRIRLNVDEDSEGDLWKIPGLMDRVERALSDRLVFRIFYWR